MEDMATMKAILLAVNLLCYVDFVDGSLFGKLAKRSVGILSDIQRFLHNNRCNCFVSEINAFFKAYRCPSCVFDSSKVL